MNTVMFVANRSFALTSSRFLLIQHFLSSGWKVVAATTKNDKYAIELTRAGVIIEPVLFNRGGLAPKTDLEAFVRLVMIYRKHQPDLIMHYQAKPIIFGNLAANLARSAKVVNAITGLGHPFFERDLTYYFAVAGYRLFMRRSSRTIFENPDDRELFVSKKLLPLNKTRLIVSVGVDTERFYPAPTVILNKKPRVLMVSRLLWQKGVKEFVEAGEIVKRQFPNVCYQLAGEWDFVHQDAVDKSWVEAAADKGTIEFLGYINDMPEELRSTDIFVLPSYYPEGVPRVLLEAAACGVPVVTVDTPGCREGVVDGVTGRLVPPRNSEALADAICELLADPELRQRMGKAARQRIESEFDIRSITEKYLDVYREIGIDI